MSIDYKSVVPWGRSYEEYVEMFHLTAEDQDKNILGCGDGPASFNSVMTEKGKQVLSIDPVYQFTKEEILSRINETYQEVLSQTAHNKDKFIWTNIKDIEDLGRIRMTAMKDFLDDYEAGKRDGRYIFAELPKLPFYNHQFDLALSSHFLFLYTDNLSLDFHIKAIDEMLRVAKEVRIFPILEMNGQRSPYLDIVIDRCEALGYRTEEVQVNYEFQKGGDTMLKISCEP